MDFKTRYSKLNTAQKQAVDAIDGPVMVIAGPGTGKTELLSVRAANILNKTDTLPENILCLTFTESGANAMRERLIEIIGKDAYKLAIHTFHSFGSEVINQNGQYFYQGANFKPADELNSYEIIRDILDSLDYKNPLTSKLNGEYTHISDIFSSISDLKRSGLTSDELLIILDKNDVVIEKTEQLISPIFADRINKSTALKLAKHIPTIQRSGEELKSSTFVSLARVLSDSLENAINEAAESNSTKPITAWKNEWFTKDEKGNFILKSKNRQKKLRALSFVYEKYLTKMQEAQLYDFDDMILRVVHAMEIFDDLRYNLQEKYQYIMVDEFQDTNMAQMRIIHNLTNNPIQGDTPNLMIVGDDDQAIYSFQGADVSNIINFRETFPKAKQIVLTENYRSTIDIISGSREIIKQGNNRLENIYDDLQKNLTAHNKSQDVSVVVRKAENISEEKHFIVNDIKKRISAGEKGSDIAVLTRRHYEINALLPYFSHMGIAVNYERRDNVLELEPVKFIESLSRLLIDITRGNHNEVDARLPEIISHKAWGIDPIEICKLSTKAHDDRKHWLEIMTTIPVFIPICEWLINTSILIKQTPLEIMLDILVGKIPHSDTDFVSPFFEYYFSKKQMDDNPTDYIAYLEGLRTIRTKLNEYHPNKKHDLVSFIEYIDLTRKMGNTISAIRPTIHSDDAVNLMTAHKSKGLEFDSVYIFNAVDNVWGNKARSRSRSITYPENLPIAPVGDSDDERLRLFYVAATRAKTNLNISYSLSDETGKSTLQAGLLIDTIWKQEEIPSPTDITLTIENAELAWYQPILETKSNDIKSLLNPILTNYKISVTHLQNFLDVTRGGPASFLINSLLHFPQSKSPNAAYGTAIHNTLQSAHAHIYATSEIQAIEDIVSSFEDNLKKQHLPEKEYQNYLQQGSDHLRAFLNLKYDTFTCNQKTELDFANQHCILDSAHITGKLDLVDIDKQSKTMLIVDYKTGKPSISWKGRDEYEKVKLHKYRQQLLFYKLLVKNSRDYHNYDVKSGLIQFIEPTTLGGIVSLDIDFDQKEFEHLAMLIEAVWHRIINLDLPDTSSYEPTLKGILAFENDLINNSVENP